MQTPLIIGNWKMNGLQAARAEARALAQAVAGLDREVVICPPATLLADLARDLAGTSIAVGGQDCHAEASGAHTGDISAEMIRDAGGSYVIVGHSERRAGHGEADGAVCDKAGAGLRAGLVTIVCVGETEAFRRKGQHRAVVEAQLDGSAPRTATPQTLVIAYEPVWAIGTGLNAGQAEIEEMHDFIRNRMLQTRGDAWGNLRVLYGGSVKPDNAAGILRCAGVDGVLVGGASLKAGDFARIATA
jgi:triosephosphate isomerase